MAGWSKYPEGLERRPGRAGSRWLTKIDDTLRQTPAVGPHWRAAQQWYIGGKPIEGRDREGIERRRGGTIRRRSGQRARDGERRPREHRRRGRARRFRRQRRGGTRLRSLSPPLLMQPRARH